MNERIPATLAQWLAEPLDAAVSQAVDRLRRSVDVQRVALMPDVHLANDVCVGTVLATSEVIYPAAVGGDIGCGMAALAFEADAELIDHPRRAAAVLAALYELVPGNKHRKPRDLPGELEECRLSDARLNRIARRDARVQLGTLGRGNHFLEFQSDEQRRLWVMVHSGSRAIGQAIANHHVRHAQSAETGLGYLELHNASAYLEDVCWARDYAAANRLSMLRAVAGRLHDLFDVTADWEALIHCDHNHVEPLHLAGDRFYVHRKGAQSAADGEPGVIPGSMGSASYHTSGRGCAESLMSCSHGAGRRLSRSEARRQITPRDFHRQVGDLWYDHRRTDKLRDEAPAAYKDIRRVMKAQRELVRIERELRPILTYKAT